MSDAYEDIIRLPHHRSRTRTPMSMTMRAAQFAPFAALTGYSDMVDETARLTDNRPNLSDEDAALLNDRLLRLNERAKDCPDIRLRYFVPDEQKAGGAIVAYTGSVRRVDEVERVLIFTDGSVIPIDDIVMIEGVIFGSPADVIAGETTKAEV